MLSYDFLVVGGGVVGLTVARELARRKLGSVCVLEKETQLAAHGSGRNSGVLHAGLYYPPETLKAKVCVRGAALLRDYLVERGLRVSRCGKVVVAQREEDVPQLDVLYDRATRNGVRIERVDTKQLAEREPEARSVGHALWSPDTWVFDPKEVVHALARELDGLGVPIRLGEAVRDVQVERRAAVTDDGRIEYGHLVNTAGLHADRLAWRMGVGAAYRVVPFRGSYKKLTPRAAERIRGLIYPTPDLSMPFLGVHLTRTISGDVTVGPTAMPALGRENYEGVAGVELGELPSLAWTLGRMVAGNHNGIRKHVVHELAAYRPRTFLEELRRLTPFVRADDIVPSPKVGLRAQLMERASGKLVMDFLIERGPASTHVLNAVSPAFTASLAFAQLVVETLRS